MITSSDKSDNTVELVDESGKVIAAAPVELDLDKLVDELWNQPEVLKTVIRKFIEDKDYSDLCIVLALSADGRTWHIFEGMVNSKKKTFKVVVPIITFESNKNDYRRPPTQAMNFVATAAVAKGLSVWIP